MQDERVPPQAKPCETPKLEEILLRTQNVASEMAELSVRVTRVVSSLVGAEPSGECTQEPQLGEASFEGSVHNHLRTIEHDINSINADFGRL